MPICLDSLKKLADLSPNSGIVIASPDKTNPDC